MKKELSCLQKINGYKFMKKNTVEKDLVSDVLENLTDKQKENLRKILSEKKKEHKSIEILKTIGSMLLTIPIQLLFKKEYGTYIFSIGKFWSFAFSSILFTVLVFRLQGVAHISDALVGITLGAVSITVGFYTLDKNSNGNNKPSILTVDDIATKVVSTTKNIVKNI